MYLSMCIICFFFFKQKTAYEMRISDWSSDVCSSDLLPALSGLARHYAVSDRWFSSVPTQTNPNRAFSLCGTSLGRVVNGPLAVEHFQTRTIWNALPAEVSWGLYFHDVWKEGKCFTHFTFRSEEHTSELQSLMRISYAGFFLQNKK